MLWYKLFYFHIVYHIIHKVIPLYLIANGITKDFVKQRYNTPYACNVF